MKATLRQQGNPRVVLPSSANGIRRSSSKPNSVGRKFDLVTSSSTTTPAAARPTKWPENIFFARDYIASSKAAAARDARCPSSTWRPALQRSMNIVTRAKQEHNCVTAAIIVGHSAQQTESTTTTIAPYEVHERRDERGILQEEEAVDRADDNVVRRSTQATQITEGTAVGGSDFIEETAAAVLCLHSQYFAGVKGQDNLVVRLCTLCREAGFMGRDESNFGDAGQEQDPFVLEELVHLGLADIRMPQKPEGREHAFPGEDQRKTLLARQIVDDAAVEISFEGFYQILLEIAVFFVCRDDAKVSDDSRSARAMHRLLLERFPWLPKAGGEGGYTGKRCPTCSSVFPGIIHV